jgi:PhzF family phenazine biosynthesis protein
MQYYIVDAFAGHRFAGNPACVCIAEESLQQQEMQQIAAEMGMPETAFLQPAKNGYSLRWFTPDFEIDLCGHATLAAGFTALHFLCPGKMQVCFSAACGCLTVTQAEDRLEMELPVHIPQKTALTAQQQAWLNLPGCEAYTARDLIVVLENEEQVRAYRPDYAALRNLMPEWLGVVLTAPGSGGIDFVSRYFCPELSAEDAVTGSAHCALTPYWAARLKKSQLTARQLSPRGGTLWCSWQIGDASVRIGGKAVLFAKGEIL